MMKKNHIETSNLEAFIVTRNKRSQVKKSIKILMDVEFCPNVQSVRFVVFFYPYVYTRRYCLLMTCWILIPTLGKQIDFASYQQLTDVLQCVGESFVGKNVIKRKKKLIWNCLSATHFYGITIHNSRHSENVKKNILNLIFSSPFDILCWLISFFVGLLEEKNPHDPS